MILHSDLDSSQNLISLCGGTAIVTAKEPTFLKDTTFVVTEATLTLQWEKSAKVLGFSDSRGIKSDHSRGPKYAIFSSFRIYDKNKKRKNVEEEEDDDEKEKLYDEEKVRDALSGRYKVVFLTTNAYKELSEWPGSISYLIKRLVFDEADSTHIANPRMFPNCFTWLVTGTPGCFHTNDRSGLGATSNNKLFDRWFKVPKVVANAKQSQDYVLERRLQEATIVGKTVYCTEAFIEKSAGLEPVVYEKIKGPDVIENFKALCKQKLPDHQYASIFGKFKLIDSNSPFLETGMLARIVILLQNAKSWPRDQCALTLRTLTDSNRMELSCCDIVVDKTFLLGCKKCPCCHADLSEPGANLSEPGQGIKAVLESYSLVSSVLTKIRESSSANAKVLLFTEQSLRSTKEKPFLISEIERLGIKYGIYGGNKNAMERRVEDLQTGKVTVLILPKKGAAGLNLQFCTHIVCAHEMDPDVFKQLVRRGQRPGRTSRLTVYHMQSSI